MDPRRKKLAEALEIEKNNLPEYNGFGERNDIKGHDLAIRYLLTNEHPPLFNDYDLLYTCIEDFETICQDYDINM